MKNNKICFSRIDKSPGIQPGVAAGTAIESIAGLMNEEKSKATPACQGDPRQSKVYLEYIRQVETMEARARLKQEKRNYLFEWAEEHDPKEGGQYEHHENSCGR